MKLKEVKVLVFEFTLFVCAICACNKDDWEARLVEEEQKLSEYITTTYGESAIDLGGSTFLVKTSENTEGAVVEAGSYILWNLNIINQITEELEYTSDIPSNRFSGSYVDGGPEITLVQSFNKIDEGLKKMKKGEKGDVYIPSRWLFRDFQPRIYSVEIVDVIRDLTIYQEALMNGYLKKINKGASVDTIKNVLSTIDKTEYNVMYCIIDEGMGDAITDGMNIGTRTSISYLIQESEVHQYQNNQELTWNTNKINTLTQTNCVGEILKKMKKGGKVVITMSSKLFWKDDNLPVNSYDQFYIPKWSVVIFTISINK